LRNLWRLFFQIQGLLILLFCYIGEVILHVLCLYQKLKRVFDIQTLRLPPLKLSQGVTWGFRRYLRFRLSLVFNVLSHLIFLLQHIRNQFELLNTLLVYILEPSDLLECLWIFKVIFFHWRILDDNFLGLFLFSWRTIWILR
jgi:hypothetical protein